MTNVLLWCAGASPTLLDECPEGDAIRQRILGTFVLLTGTFALATSSYALLSISAWPAVALLGGLLWASMIFTLDRFILSTVHVVRDRRGVYRIPFVQIVPRIALAIGIGMSIAVPLEQLIFHREIAAEIQDVLIKQEDANSLQQRRDEQELQKRAVAECDHQFSVPNLQKQVDDNEADINETTNGRDQTRAICAEKCRDLKARQRDLEPKLAAAQQKSGECLRTGMGSASARQFLSLSKSLAERNQVLEDERRSALDQPSFLEKFVALRALENKPGTGADTVIHFIPLLFVLFEMIPVLAKYLAGASRYEMLSMRDKAAAIDMVERLDFESANAFSMRKIESQRQVDMAALESTTFKEVGSSMHDRIKAAVAEHVDRRLREWKPSSIEKDVAELERMFSVTMLERFGRTISGLARRSAEAAPMLPEVGPGATAPRSPARSLPDVDTGPDGRNDSAPPASRSAPKPAVTPPASLVVELHDKAARSSPARGEHSPPADASSPMGWAQMQSAYVRKLAEAGATHTVELASSALTHGLGLLVGPPATGLAALHLNLPPAAAFGAALIVLVGFVHGRSWMRRRAALGHAGGLT